VADGRAALLAACVAYDGAQDPAEDGGMSDDQIELDVRGLWAADRDAGLSWPDGDAKRQENTR
jgi:hypothetical protein